MQTCRKCHSVKPLSEFRKDKSKLRGVQTVCKACAKPIDRRRRQNNRDAYNKAPREWKARNIEKVRAYQREYKRKWKAELYVAHKAHWAVARAVKTGRLRKPRHCELCHDKGPLQAHHVDYAQPLAVAWLCVFCHRAQHPGTEP